MFKFTPQGEIASFEAERYYGGGEGAKRETWLIEAEDYAVFEGIRVVSKCRVTWKLDKGDHHWLNLNITGINYNNNAPL